RWDEGDEETAGNEKAPLTRTLDKKEVEDEVAEALRKLGHDATLHCLDGSVKSLHALARLDGALIFNLAEAVAGNDTADACIAGYLELLQKRFTGAGSHGSCTRRTRRSRRRSSSSTASTRPCSRGRIAGASTSRTTSSFPSS